MPSDHSFGARATALGFLDMETPSAIRGIAPFIVIRTTRASSSCVSLMYSCGGRGINGGGDACRGEDEYDSPELTEGGATLLLALPRALTYPFRYIGGGASVLEAESYPSYFALSNAFSSAALSTRWPLLPSAIGGKGAGLLLRDGAVEVREPLRAGVELAGTDPLRGGVCGAIGLGVITAASWASKRRRSNSFSAVALEYAGPEKGGGDAS